MSSWTRLPLLVAFLVLTLFPGTVVEAFAPPDPVNGDETPVAPPMPPPTPLPTPSVPLSDEEIQITRGDQTITVHPIRTVQTAEGREAVSGRIIVGFVDDLSEDERADVHGAAAARGLATARGLERVGPHAQVVDVSGARSLEEAIAIYTADPRVAYAEPDFILHLLDEPANPDDPLSIAAIPNDPFFSSQWGMTKISAPAAWDSTQGSPSRYVAILDSGIYDEVSNVLAWDGGRGHRDLRGKVAFRANLTTETCVGVGTDDCNGHGSHVAGIVAATTNNSVGVGGVGYNTRLFNVKVCIFSGSCSTAAVASGIYLAADNGAHVINLSLGGSTACSATYQNAANYAWARNVVVVAAAGNDGSSVPTQPASCANVLAVASIDSNDAKSSFSNYGTWVDVAAPGRDILSTYFVNSNESTGFPGQNVGYVYFSGTSQAAPHVSGLAALVWASGWAGTADGVVNLIKSRAQAIANIGVYWESGRIQAHWAVRPQFVSADTPTPGASVCGSVNVSGWALDLAATSGTGVDAIHIYRDSPAGAGTFVGAATYSGSRPDVGAAFGSSQFNNSGWSFLLNTAGLGSGALTLYIYAHSAVTGGWQQMMRSVSISGGNPFANIDIPGDGATVGGPVTVAGWAIDHCASSGTGVDAIHIYRDGPAGGGGTFVGAATYGMSRPDVGAAFGSSQFDNSGWSFDWGTDGLSGSHTLYTYAHSTVTGNWQELTRSVNIVNQLVNIDIPSEGATVGGTVQVAGWAIDRGASSGTGVDAVHIYRDGPAGAGTFVGAATYGLSRPDVGAAFGSTEFNNSGWSFDWNTLGLSPGIHTLYVYARSTVTGNWQLLTRSVSIPSGSPHANIDIPAEGATVSGTVTAAGWAIDLGAVSGTGVDAIHIYRDGPAGSGTFVGAATYGGSRPDVGAFFGSSQFNNSGWSFEWNTSGLPSGSHTLYVYAHSTVSGNWQQLTRSVCVGSC